MTGVNGDSDTQNSFCGTAGAAIQAGSIHGGVHVHRSADHVDSDARTNVGELGVAELYGKAADRLGSEKPLVRLAGLHMLERLAKENAGLRQAIVDMVCAYLRMPCQLDVPADEPVLGGFLHVHHRSRFKPPVGSDHDVRAYNDRMQEREVRLAAQRIITGHLRPGDPDNPVSTFWPGIALDLTGAVLIDFSLARCAVRTATFESATFIGHTDFTAAVFTGSADFRIASFAGPSAIVYFQSVVFADSAYFMGAVFAGSAAFAGAMFRGSVNFASSAFGGLADFAGAAFAGTADFSQVDFFRSATFIETSFGSTAYFYRAAFPALHTSFILATFARDAPDEIRQFCSPEKLRALWVDAQRDSCDP
jgi:uncharacterized protein YjbI with pentapeptide repeats